MRNEKTTRRKIQKTRTKLSEKSGLPRSRPEPLFLGGAGAVFWSGAGAGICLELEPEPKISKMGGSGNPDTGTGTLLFAEFIYM